MLDYDELADEYDLVYDDSLIAFTTDHGEVLFGFVAALGSIGSAVMIGPRHALTAGHVVYDEREGGWASSVVVTVNGWPSIGDVDSIETVVSVWMTMASTPPMIVSPTTLNERMA